MTVGDVNETPEFEASSIIYADENQKSVPIARAINQVDAAVLEVVIYEIPDSVEFSAGDRDGDTLTLLPDEIASLKILIAPNANEAINLELEVVVSQDGLGGDVIATSVTQALSIGNEIVGTDSADNLTATNQIDHVDGGADLDTLTIDGNLSDFEFALVGNDLKITQTNGDGINVDYLHAVEQLQFNDGSQNIISLILNLETTDLSENELFNWFENEYAGYIELNIAL